MTWWRYKPSNYIGSGWIADQFSVYLCSDSKDKVTSQKLQKRNKMDNMVEGGLKEIIVDGMKVTAKDDIFDLLTQVFCCKSDSSITIVTENFKIL